MYYIDREAAVQALGPEPYVWHEDDPAQLQENLDWEYYKNAIEAVPIADVAPVRHAAAAESAISKTGLMCTACHSDTDADAMYCKYCGARLDEVPENAPAIDAVSVIRCENCDRWSPDPDSYGLSDGPKGRCMKSFERTYSDDFCSYGQRKEQS